MTELRPFELRYFSEVHAEITLSVEDGEAVVSATHVHPEVGIVDWFHFSSVSPDSDPLVVRDDSIVRALARMGGKLYPGARGLLEEYQLDRPMITSFFDHYFAALVTGRFYFQSTHLDEDVILGSGEFLLDEWKELS